ncbi:lysosomal beta glucosidase-like [Pyrus ussuriensis x Pyrus communis]|uniref:Lysosomal beta glucosidase-like n=1 Tax=Pyrus ussuriensis x Pyrus communis TaxID=2448454 RepID=A0A5N5HGN3_9ROSA|nr:lysosomal beta glucosidase-like [Pyrus ussuriensis x Pyrus communis]
MINGFQKGALSSRLGIPMIYRIDAVHGHNNVYNATIFPHNVGLGATRDPELVRRLGSATALEARATGIPYVFAPCIAVCRDPRWGRCYESYSEDHKIVQEMTEIIPGLQGDIPANSQKGAPYVSGNKKVAACAKHFVGDGGTSKGINEYDTVIDQQELLSIHMPAYSDSIIKGVSTVMISYFSWNGKKMHANRDLITDFLRAPLNLRFCYIRLEGIDRITSPPHSNYTYSVQASVLAGIDMVMVPINYKEFINDLINLVKNNVVPMDRIDDAVGRILLVKFTMGLFENPLADFSLVNELGSQRFGKGGCQKIRRAFEEGKSGNITDPVIPLPKKVSKILVAGSHADNLGYQCGGWTIACIEVIYGEKPNGNFVKSNNFAYAIVVVGEHPYAETAGDSPNIMIPQEPDPSVISNVCESVKCIVILITGRPIVIEPYISSIDAMVAAWLPGSEGQGFTDVIFGDHGFSGKLPRTWFRTVGQLPMNVGDSHYDPLFPFGFGLETESVKELVTRSTSAGVVARPCILIVVVALILNL